MTDDPSLAHHKRRRTLIASGVVAAVAFSLGMSFAAVPLYRVFCQATGFAGTTQRAEAASTRRGARTIAVRFDANVAPGLPWSFEPETPEINLRTGETATVYFKVTNRSARPTLAEAQYNVTPDVAGAYFDKIACFCFSQQHLGPNQTAEMPVVFFLNPALEEDETMAKIDTLTLSYTFFAPAAGGRPVATAEPTSAKPKL